MQIETINKLAEYLDVDGVDVEHVASNLFGGKRKTFRSGKIDSWKEELSDSELEIVNEEIGDVLSVWNYA